MQKLTSLFGLHITAVVLLASCTETQNLCVKEGEEGQNENFGKEKDNRDKVVPMVTEKREEVELKEKVGPMPVRRTARVVLFDTNDKVLLMQISDNTVKSTKTNSDKPPFWVTIGGKLEEGESLEEAARREVFEETGIKEVVLSQPVWSGEQVLNWKGIDTKVCESFLFAKTGVTDIVTFNLTPEEKQVVKQYKWWSLEELKNTSECVFPPKLSQYLSDAFPHREAILKGVPKQYPIKIDISD